MILGQLAYFVREKLATIDPRRVRPSDRSGVPDGYRYEELRGRHAGATRAAGGGTLRVLESAETSESHVLTAR